MKKRRSTRKPAKVRNGSKNQSLSQYAPGKRKVKVSGYTVKAHTRSYPKK